ncbi:rRNA pseudouridine synthase [Oscillibacter sp. MSJ-2]|uniref:Pseudouridine synthase n=1 Tax=Dysosmobacter acutus TaxID=2841504 RepID=A0ABS6FB53_9FIRM|nr:pseudouridine synthase [Dysosmobacter acutus]MBU5627290.1 rRNA pseudouridine synthase [Dysosmobacter acutus]
MEERVQKIIAASGLCSRRAAEQLLESGRVFVDGHVARLGEKADPDRAEITVDGRPISKNVPAVYIMLNKPRGYVTTLSDEKGRPVVTDLLKGLDGVRVFPVGRLDMDSEGLLLLTNDGELMQKLLHPSHEIQKTYFVSVYGDISGVDRRLSALKEVNGEAIRPAQVEILRSGGRAADLLITIHEGKNRQIRKMCGSCGLMVKRLRRIREHTLELGRLPAGQWRYLTESELAKLRDHA